MANVNEVGSSAPAFDGVGVFLSSWMCIEQAISDGVVDVFGSCRLVRSHLSSAISSKAGTSSLSCLDLSQKSLEIFAFIYCHSHRHDKLIILLFFIENCNKCRRNITSYVSW